MVKLLPATRSAKYKSVCMFVQVAAFPSNCWTPSAFLFSMENAFAAHKMQEIFKNDLV